MSNEALSIPTDPQGYLTDPSLWNKEVAIVLAQREQIELIPAHWEIIELLRDFYQKYQRAPNMRALTKTVNEAFGADKATSLYLFQLFPKGPVQQGCKIAGLPRPAHCL